MEEFSQEMKRGKLTHVLIKLLAMSPFISSSKYKHISKLISDNVRQIIICRICFGFGTDKAVTIRINMVAQAKVTIDDH